MPLNLILQFLFEEEKVPLFLSCRCVHVAKTAELEEIREAFCLRAYNLDRQIEADFQRALALDLDSEQSEHSD